MARAGAINKCISPPACAAKYWGVTEVAGIIGRRGGEEGGGGAKLEHQMRKRSRRHQLIRGFAHGIASSSGGGSPHHGGNRASVSGNVK